MDPKLQHLARAIPIRLQTAARAVQRLENWETYLLDCAGLAGSDRTVYNLRDGTQFAARLGTVDRYVLNEVWFRRTYLPKFLELGQDAVVVDIGAHIGFFSVMAAKIARELYSFEPNPDNVLLRTNLAINGIGNVVVAQEAVADKPGYYRYL